MRGMGAHRVVSRKAGWLIGGQVSEVDPVPGGDEDILRLDVPMADSSSMALSQTLQQLKGYPALQKQAQHEIRNACIWVSGRRMAS